CLTSIAQAVRADTKAAASTRQATIEGIADLGVRSSEFGVRNSDSSAFPPLARGGQGGSDERTADFGWQISDFRAQIPHPQSQIPNPVSRCFFGNIVVPLAISRSQRPEYPVFRPLRTRPGQPRTPPGSLIRLTGSTCSHFLEPPGLLGCKLDPRTFANFDARPLCDRLEAPHHSVG